MVSPVITHAAPASKSIPVPQIIDAAVDAFIIIAPATTLTVYNPSLIVYVAPVVPQVTTYGPSGLVIVYLGTASAEKPGVITVSTDPPTVTEMEVELGQVSVADDSENVFIAACFAEVSGECVMDNADSVTSSTVAIE